jgi:catechol 2,3-dioxygenase-like lactoylglutathione lyase family enzyme
MEDVMRFHPLCIVADIDEAIRLWRDVMGFEVKTELTIPDGHDYGPTVMAPRALLEDLYRAQGATATVAVLVSRDGARMELLQPHLPGVEQTPPECLLYGHSDIREIGLVLENIDGFFEEVRAAGYKTQSEYVWSSANMGRFGGVVNV